MKNNVFSQTCAHSAVSTRENSQRIRQPLSGSLLGTHLSKLEICKNKLISSLEGGGCFLEEESSKLRQRSGCFPA